MDTQIGVTLHDPDADAAALDDLTGRLRDELLALDVDDVTRPRTGAGPPGTRAVDVASVGTLVVALTSSAALVEQVVRTVRAWLDRSPPARSVELTVAGSTLKLSAATSEQQDQLVREFVRAAHPSPP